MTPQVKLNTALFAAQRAMREMGAACMMAADAMRELTVGTNLLPEQPLPRSTHGAVREILRRSVAALTPLTIHAVLKHAGRDDSNVAISKALSRLEKDGTIRRTPRHMYEWAGARP